MRPVSAASRRRDWLWDGCHSPKVCSGSRQASSQGCRLAGPYLGPDLGCGPGAAVHTSGPGPCASHGSRVYFPLPPPFRDLGLETSNQARRCAEKLTSLSGEVILKGFLNCFLSGTESNDSFIEIIIIITSAAAKEGALAQTGKNAPIPLSSPSLLTPTRPPSRRCASCSNPQPKMRGERGPDPAALSPRDRAPRDSSLSGRRLPAPVDLGCLIPFRRGEGQQRRGDMTD